MQTDKVLSAGSSTGKSGSLADSYMKTENLVEPGCNAEQDTHIITSQLHRRNVEITKATMMNFKNLNQSPHLAKLVRFHYPRTFWMVQNKQS